MKNCIRISLLLLLVCTTLPGCMLVDVFDSGKEIKGKRSWSVKEHLAKTGAIRLELDLSDRVEHRTDAIEISGFLIPREEVVPRYRYKGILKMKSNLQVLQGDGEYSKTVYVCEPRGWDNGRNETKGYGLEDVDKGIRGDTAPRWEKISTMGLSVRGDLTLDWVLADENARELATGQVVVQKETGKVVLRLQGAALVRGARAMGSEVILNVTHVNVSNASLKTGGELRIPLETLRAAANGQ